MTKTKSTKRALLMSALALFLCVSMLVGTTFAWFTDSVTSGSNKIVAGNLDVQLLMDADVDGTYDDISNSTLPIFGEGSIAQNNNAQTLWEPGKTQVAYLGIKNGGSLALKYKVALNVENVSNDLYEVMEYAIVADADKDNPVIGWNGGSSVVEGDQTVTGDVSLAAGATHYFALAIHMDEETGNDYMAGKVNFDLTVLATQDTVEKDSFGDQYDKDATYPLVVSDTFVGGDAITAGDVSVKLPAGAAKGVYSLKVDSVMENTDASGQTTLSLNIDLLKDGVKVESANGVSYAVDINVGKNLDVVELKHKGEAIADFGYDMNTGIVSFTTSSFSPFEVVYNTLAAKVGNNVYCTIDEAIANWTNNTTLTLLSDVTLPDAVQLKSTEHHILDLATYTLTAASDKNAFEIIACGNGSAERTAITVKADKNNPGGINAGKKCVVFYDYSKGGISVEDRPIIRIEGGVFTGGTSGVAWGSNVSVGIYVKGSAARKCATINISGGTFDCSIIGNGKSKLLISGGKFNYTVSSQGDSTALRLISGGTFKTLGFMTADSNNTKFWIGTKMGVSDVGVYIDENNYLVVGGPVITEAGDRFKDPASSYSSWSSYLQYSSAKDNGLYYVK